MLHALAADGFKPVKYFSIDRVFRCARWPFILFFCSFRCARDPRAAVAGAPALRARVQNTHLLALEPLPPPPKPTQQRVHRPHPPGGVPPGAGRQRCRRCVRDAGAEGGQRSRFFFSEGAPRAPPPIIAATALPPFPLTPIPTTTKN
jgi:hypothetical protein